MTKSIVASSEGWLRHRELQAARRSRMAPGALVVYNDTSMEPMLDVVCRTLPEDLRPNADRMLSVAGGDMTALVQFVRGVAAEGARQLNHLERRQDAAEVYLAALM